MQAKELGHCLTALCEGTWGPCLQYVLWAEKSEALASISRTCPISNLHSKSENARLCWTSIESMGANKMQNINKFLS